MLHLSFFKINALNPDLGIDSIKKYIIASTLTKDHVSAIIFEPNHPAFMPNCDWVIKQIEVLLKKKMTFFKRNTSKDSFSTTDYYTIEGHHHPLLINYPIYESEAHFRPTFDHHLLVLSILKELDTPTSVNPEPPLYIVTYYPNKQISQPAIPALPATLGDHFNQYALKHNKLHMLSICEQVKLDSHYLPSCDNAIKAEKYLRQNPSIPYILRPSTQSRDNAELVFTLSSYISLINKCFHIRFLIEFNKLYKEEGYGKITEEMNLTEYTLETVMHNSLRKGIRFEIEKHQKTTPASDSGNALTDLDDIKATQIMSNSPADSKLKSSRSPSTSYLRSLSILKISCKPKRPTIGEEELTQQTSPTFQISEV